MSKYIGDICVSTGEYTDNQGQAKKRWLKLGAAFEDDHGNISFKLDALPMPKADGTWLKLFKSQPTQQPAPQQPASFEPPPMPGADEQSGQVPF